MQLTQPIFIIGVGRSGSTVLHHSLSRHKQTAWLSRYCQQKPHKPAINHLAMQILDLPLPQKYIRKLIYPSEAYRFWDYYASGFSGPCRDLRQDDVTPAVAKRVKNVLQKMLTPKRRRLLIKITGWPRVGYIKEIFPDAKFIHIYRDGRAVVNSLLQVPWWSGWRGPGNWRWGSLTPEQYRRWEEHSKSFVALAALEWEILMAAYDKAEAALNANNLLRTSYEDLCQEPLEQFQLLAEFGNLEWTPQFESLIRHTPFKNTNYKWQQNLTPSQQHILNACIEPALKKYGYA